MGIARSLFLGIVGMGLLVAATGSAAAEEFIVVSTPYRVNHTLTAEALWNTYELRARNEQQIRYSMAITTPGACASLFFIKGHNPGPESAYFSTYSQVGCVESYSNTFPVEPADGTEFSVLVAKYSDADVSYSLTIEVMSPAVPAWTLGVGIVAILGVAPVILYPLWKRSRELWRRTPVPASTAPAPTSPADAEIRTGPSGPSSDSKAETGI